MTTNRYPLRPGTRGPNHARNCRSLRSVAPRRSRTASDGAPRDPASLDARVDVARRRAGPHVGADLRSPGRPGVGRRGRRAERAARSRPRPKAALSR